jgi:hypothetical protein
MSLGIARPSVASLLLRLKQAGSVFATATGFIVERDSIRYLVTNRHVFRGLQSLPDPPIPPDHLEIAQNKAGALGTWELREERLYDEHQNPRWFEHPDQPAAGWDVAALPLEKDQGIEMYGYDPWSPGPGLRAGISEAVQIIGFPFGATGGGSLGIWVRGFIATEPDIDWADDPCFLVDSRTRKGQSGSPVIIYSAGGAAVMASGTLQVGGGLMEEFVGVYSGRINEESDLGIVWKVRLVREIIDAKQRATL